jgi:hypothetical protein
VPATKTIKDMSITNHLADAEFFLNTLVKMLESDGQPAAHAMKISTAQEALKALGGAREIHEGSRVAVV